MARHARPFADQHIICGTSELDDENVDAPIYAIDKRILEETFQPESRTCATLRLLQLLQSAFEFADHACDGCRHFKLHLGSGEPTPRVKASMPHENFDDLLKKSKEAIDKAHAIRARVEKTQSRFLELIERHVQLKRQFLKRRQSN